jgi:hypothetical protein
MLRDDLLAKGRSCDVSGHVPVSIFGLPTDGYLVNRDQDLAREVYQTLLSQKDEELRVRAVNSLAVCAECSLDFVLDQGDAIVGLAKSRKGEGLLYRYLLVLLDSRFNNWLPILKRFDTWFPVKALERIQSPEVLAEILNILKICARQSPQEVLKLAERCPIRAKQVAGPMAAIYENISFRDSDPELLRRLSGDCWGSQAFRRGGSHSH